ncbi:MAG: hypothetical protein COA58_10295 [Bacteroidetes bacterium]|nr:MAG: hypothetical protein COA58_10295 [Bacteroidota bacterium]
MLKKVIYPVLLLIAASCFYFGLQPNGESYIAEKSFKMSKEQRMQEAIDHEFDRTVDPKLKRIPSERLLVAQDYYAERAGFKEKTSSSLSNIQWSERGPNNVGGRTRSIVYLSATKVLAAGMTGGLWITEDITVASPTWTPVGDFLSKSINISCIAQDPSTFGTLYAGTGEAFGSAHLGSGIYKSTDTGSTWSILSATTFTPPSSNFTQIAKILVSADGHVYAATKGYYCNTNGGLMKSSNGGTSWTRVIGSNGTTCSNGSDLRGADIEENDAGDLFFASAYPYGHIFISNKATHGSNVGNSGNWSDVTPGSTPATDWGRIEIDVSKASSSGVIYAACEGAASNDVTGIYYSSNKGASWTSRTVPTICDQGSNSVYTRSQGWYDQVVQIDPTDDATVYIGGIDLLRSTNSGSSWSQITTWSGYWTSGGCSGSVPPVVHADQHGFFFNPFTSNAAISSNDGGIYYSSNTNATTPSWSAKNSGYNITQFYGVATHPTDADYMIGGTQDNGSWKMTGSGVTAGIYASGGDGAYSHIHQTSPTYQTTQYTFNNFYLSSNSGSSFSSQTSSNISTGRFINPSDMDDANNRIFSAGSANVLEVRTGVNTGSLTRATYSLSFNSNQLTALKVSPNNSTTLYVGDDDGYVYKITGRNGTPTIAQTWLLPSAGSGYVSSIDVWESSGGTDDSILVTQSSYGVTSVYVTANGTNASPTFTDIDDNSTLQDMPVRWGLFDKNDPSRIFIATDLGVMGTQNINGNSTAWTMINNNDLPSVRVDQLVYDADDNLVAATHGRGIWETKNPCNLTAPLPTTAGTYTSSLRGTDGSYDCFCDTDGNLLLALDLTGSGAVIPDNGVSLQIGATATTSWNSSGGIVTNSVGGAIMNRKWEVAPTTQPTSTVKVRHFFTNSEYTSIVSALGSLTSPTTVTNPNQLQFYKLTSAGTFGDPHASGATGTIYPHGSSPSTSEWTYATYSSDHSAEYLVSGFSGGGGGGGGGGVPLPIELLSFDVHSVKGSDAQLNWVTASEINNYGFEIERSFDGLEFVKMGFVEGNNNSAELGTYDYLDKEVGNHQSVFYRLKQVDFNGSFEYSEIRKLRFEDDLKQLTVFPNPAKDELTVNMTDVIVDYKVYSFNGLVLDIKLNGSSKLDISSLSAGVYFLEVQTEFSKHVKKFIVK